MKNLLLSSTLSLLLLVSAARASDVVPATRPATPTAITNVRVLLPDGTFSGPTTVVLDGAKVAAIGAAAPATATTIDGTGKRLYPGLIDSFSNLGLVETESIRATLDGAETGTVNPNVLAQRAVNPDSDLLPVARMNGVLMCLTVPSGGLVSGQAAVMQLDGWTFEDMTLQGGVGMVINWPRMRPARSWDDTSTAADQTRQRDDQLASLKALFSDANAYRLAAKASTSPASGQDAKWAAMIPVLEGKSPLLVRADDLQQINSAIAFTVERHLKLVIVGGYDAALAAPLLVKHNIPVILTGTQRMPERRSDPYDAAYTLPARLSAAGVKYAIATNRWASMSRTLPYHAAAAVPYGLSREQAILSITRFPAEILGVSDRVGTIEPGKLATVFLADGDILEEPTHVTSAWIAGRPIELTDKQTRLNDKYLSKYKQLGLIK